MSAAWPTLVRVNGFVAIGVTMGLMLIMTTGSAVAYYRKMKAARQAYEALADERGWQYQDSVPVPDWVGEPRRPNHPRPIVVAAECRRCLTGTHRGRRVQLFELVYPMEELPDRIYSVACLLDPPPQLPILFASVTGRGSRPQPDPFVIHTVGSAHTTYDMLPPVISLLEGWPEIRVWGIGEIIWTMVRGELQLDIIDDRLSQLDVMADTILAGR